jgi:PleD family two-component response regulator
MQAQGWPVTASVGAVAFVVPPDSADAALAAVDTAMYQAKRAGKNQVCYRTLDRAQPMPASAAA